MNQTQAADCLEFADFMPTAFFTPARQRVQVLGEVLDQKDYKLFLIGIQKDSIQVGFGFMHNTFVQPQNFSLRECSLWVVIEAHWDTDKDNDYRLPGPTSVTVGVLQLGVDQTPDPQATTEALERYVFEIGTITKATPEERRDGAAAYINRAPDSGFTIPFIPSMGFLYL